MFFKYSLEDDFKVNPFDELFTSVNWESMTEGRKGTNIVLDYQSNDNKMVTPLVRTTTRCLKANQRMLPVHHDLIHLIQTAAKKENHDDVSFNHALMEVYDQRYRTMKYHSDQALDLHPDSWIALFSCYHNPLCTASVRTLRIKNKTNYKEMDIVLDHNSVVLFSTATNSHWWHKIILPSPLGKKENTTVRDSMWLGVTLRQAQTFVSFCDDEKKPYFVNTQQPLTVATPEESQQFYSHRGLENATVGRYVYPDTTYTLSQGDLLPIV